MSRFALQKCSNLAQMLLANLLIARVFMMSFLLISTKMVGNNIQSSFLIAFVWDKLFEKLYNSISSNKNSTIR